ncbi:hypothetical protein ACPER7_06130 [Acinetobacter dispersus]|uniref:hypothetical protein n=1 Tax=Acinetobacter dispersus TaxID=70348 RepID=UPI003C2FD42E
MDNQTIQTYINNFRRYLGNRLKSGIGLKTSIYHTSSQGAVIVFHLGRNLVNEDNYKPTSYSVAEILTSKINQHAFSGDLRNLNFSGTNTIMEPDKIILIKDSSPNEWTDEAARNDVNKLFHSRNSQ